MRPTSMPCFASSASYTACCSTPGWFRCKNNTKSPHSATGCAGFEGELFNREGQMWPEADITLVDLATFALEGYEAQLAISYISLINHINNLGERDQHLARPIVNITDEAHIITVNPLLARFLTKCSKMWRKLGIWLWLATQNLADFPDEAKKLLNMIEWWELLVMPPEEIDLVCRFKALTEEQR
ncbi:hypothetical protein AB3E93_002005 [Salmonella enterica]